MKSPPYSPLPRPVTKAQWNDKPPGYEEPARVETYQQAIGVDLAFTPGSGDHTSIIPVACLADRYYVRLVRRVRRDVLDIRRDLLTVSASYPGAALVSYVSEQEKRAILPLLAANDGPVVVGIPARVEKRVRAQRTAELWNSGRIVVAPNRPWTADFLRELRNFTGNGKEPDDQVDALVSAIDFLEAMRSIQDDSFGAVGRTRV